MENSFYFSPPRKHKIYSQNKKREYGYNNIKFNIDANFMFRIGKRFDDKAGKSKSRLEKIIVLCVGSSNMILLTIVG